MIRALLGGTFDPVHLGHVAIVERLLREGLAERVHVVPAARSPHRGEPVAPAAERVRMARLAFAAHADVEVDDLEARRGGPSYTVETLAALVARHPGDPWRLVIGADQLAGWPAWREPDRLLRLAQLVVVARRGAAAAAPPGALALADFDHPASATAVRRELAAGRVPRELLPAAVADHIAAHGLYGWRKGDA